MSGAGLAKRLRAAGLVVVGVSGGSEDEDPQVMLTPTVGVQLSAGRFATVTVEAPEGAEPWFWWGREWDVVKNGTEFDGLVADCRAAVADEAGFMALVGND